VTKTIKKYQDRTYRDNSTVALIIVNLVAIIGGITSLFIASLQSFFSPIPYSPYVILYGIWFCVSIVATVYSLVFVTLAFTIHPAENTMKVIYTASGFVIGLILISMFSVENWVERRYAPDSIVGISTIMIFASSICVTMYAYRSMKEQKLNLNKASMRYYFLGSLIFTSGLVFVFLLTGLKAIFVNNAIIFLLDNLTVILQIINAVLTYIAFFRPDWFVQKYGIRKRAEAWFANAAFD
jgi:hypothetical protein